MPLPSERNSALQQTTSSPSAKPPLIGEVFAFGSQSSRGRQRGLVRVEVSA